MTPDQEHLRAVLDTNVLVPASLRDTLLRAAEAGLYEPFWSNLIIDELRRTLVDNDLTTSHGADRLVTAMRTSFPNSTVRGFEPLIDQMPNDPKDRHVLAVAVSRRVLTIVTFNVRHFRPNDLSLLSVEALTPDTFLMYLFEQAPRTMLSVVTEQAASLRRPSSLEALLARISKLAPEFARSVLEYNETVDTY